MNTVEDIFFNIGIVLFQCLNQLFDFCSFGVVHTVFFGKTAGTLNEFQMIIIFPGNDGIFMNAVKRSDKFHTLKVGTVKFGRHGLKLSSVKDTQKKSFNYVIEVMSQSDFITAEFTGFLIEVSSSHSCTEITRTFTDFICNGKNICFKEFYRNMQ